MMPYESRIKAVRLYRVGLMAGGLVCAGVSITAVGQPEREHGHDHARHGVTTSAIVERSPEFGPQPKQVVPGRVVRGYVFADLDGDGRRSAGEDGVSGVGVSNGVELS